MCGQPLPSPPPPCMRPLGVHINSCLTAKGSLGLYHYRPEMGVDPHSDSMRKKAKFPCSFVLLVILSPMLTLLQINPSPHLPSLPHGPSQLKSTSFFLSLPYNNIKPLDTTGTLSYLPHNSKPYLTAHTPFRPP